MMGAWSHRMKDTITIAPKLAPDEDGNPQAGAQSEIKGRIVEGAVRERGTNGETIEESDAIATHDEVTEEHYIWLPGTDTADIHEAVTPSNVKKGRLLSSDEPLWEVTL